MNIQPANMIYFCNKKVSFVSLYVNYVFERNYTYIFDIENAAVLFLPFLNQCDARVCISSANGKNRTVHIISPDKIRNTWSKPL